MKKGLFAIFLLLLSCYSTERNCLEFHQGTFDFETIVNGQLETSRFVRNGTTEIEYYKALGEWLWMYLDQAKSYLQSRQASDSN